MVDAMAGVRAAVADLLGIPVREAGSVAQTLDVIQAQPVSVVVTGLRLPDGTAADLIASCGCPVVVLTWLPADERTDVDLRGAAAVVLAGAFHTLPRLVGALVRRS